MALIGTISGSVGAGGVRTYKTAITGSVVIANQPGAAFPTAPADTILYVSSALDLKDGSTPGVVTFAADTVHSGSSYYQAITTPATTTLGRMYLDSSDNALSYFTETGLRARPGRQHLTRARNADTATISKGNAVRITSSVGSQTTVIRAIASATAIGRSDTNQIIGIAAQDIAINATGYITTLGRMTDIDTSSYTTEGGILFVSSITSGAMTQTQPTAPAEVITVGTMIRKNVSQGEIYVHPVQPTHLADIQSFNADPSTWQNGSSIVYDSATSTWKTQKNGYLLTGSFSGSFSGDITGSNVLLTNGFIVTGSGIIEANSSTAALRITQQGSGNAILVEDSINPDSSPFVVATDGKVGVGTLSPTANLFVSGNDPLIPVLAVRGHDVTVNTLTVTSSVGASTAIGFVNIDQGNYTDKYGLMINNVGVGKSGLKIAANSTGGSFAIDNMNTTPQITMTHKNLWFNSVSTAFDVSQVTYKFIENNKAATYPNQKTFLISGNTNGPKTGSYFEVEKSGSVAPIKILELQGDTTNNALFISGSILVTGSAFINGDVIVTGSNLTTIASTFNLVNSTATTVNFAGAATTLSIGNVAGSATISSALTGASGITIGGASTSDLNASKTTGNLFNTTATTVNFAGAATNLTMGASTGRTTISNDLAVGTGNIIGAPGSGANVMTLISSGNIIMRLDTDNSATGHTFEVQDYTGSVRFKVSEDNAVEVGGTLYVTGASNLAGNTTLATVSERLLNSTGGTGAVNFDLASQDIFYVNGPAGNITANFINTPTNNNRIITPTVILSQSATPRIINALQIDAVSQTILWANKVPPVGNANQQDVYGFSLIRSGSAWTVLGQMSTYG